MSPLRPGALGPRKNSWLSLLVSGTVTFKMLKEKIWKKKIEKRKKKTENKCSCNFLIFVCLPIPFCLYLPQGCIFLHPILFNSPPLSVHLIPPPGPKSFYFLPHWRFIRVVFAFYACICIKILRFFSLHLFFSLWTSLCHPLPTFFMAGSSFCRKKLYFLNDFSGFFSFFFLFIFFSL